MRALLYSYYGVQYASDVFDIDADISSQPSIAFILCYLKLLLIITKTFKGVVSHHHEYTAILLVLHIIDDLSPLTQRLNSISRMFFT